MTRGRLEKLPEGRLARLRASWSDELCAEHDGSLASFEHAGDRLADLIDYPPILKRTKPNLKRIGTITGWSIGGVLTFGPLAFIGAPGMAAALGSAGVLGAASTGTAIASLSGAALTSASLAALGGGFGMVGGVLFLTAAGAALGARQGAAVSNAYFGQIKDFGIHKYRDGEGPALVFIDGFLTQKAPTWHEWNSAVRPIYGANAQYVVTWETKRLLDLGSTAGSLGLSGAARAAMGGLARRAIAKAPSAVGRLTAASQLGDLITNPWHVAMAKASMTGILLADLVARTQTEEGFILIGHSLGARVIYYLLEALSTTELQSIRDVYLLGGAVGRGDRDAWSAAMRSVRGTVYNCHSRKDAVLKNLYRLGTGLQSQPAGIGPIECDGTRLANIDVSDLVSGHTEYKSRLPEILARCRERRE